MEFASILLSCFIQVLTVWFCGVISDRLLAGDQWQLRTSGGHIRFVRTLLYLLRHRTRCCIVVLRPR